MKLTPKELKLLNTILTVVLFIGQDGNKKLYKEVWDLRKKIGKEI